MFLCMFWVPMRDTSAPCGSPVTTEVTREGRHRPAELPGTHVRPRVQRGERGGPGGRRGTVHLQES